MHDAARNLTVDLLAMAIERATARIAPTWPLDRFIAVNPLWGFVESPLPDVSARLASLAGARLLPRRADLRERWLAGEFGLDHVRAALAETGSPLSVGAVVAALAAEVRDPAPRARVTDLMERSTAGLSWPDMVTANLGRFCAAWFDEGQAAFGPPRAGGMYATWRRGAAGDPLLGRLPGWRAAARALPGDARGLIAMALDALEVPLEEREAYLTALLLDLNGWAAWCAYRRWIARQEGGDDDALVDLLAMRLAWEWLAFEVGGPALAARWARAKAEWTLRDAEASQAQAADVVLHRALELAYRERLVAAIRTSAPPTQAPSVQALFCIDVRSERIRRALEAVDPTVRTLGFAGFFGLPIAYRPAGAGSAEPRLPGLLAPRLLACDVAPRSVGERRVRRLEERAAWKRFAQGAGSAFAFVEAAGAFYAPKLVTDAFGLTRPVDRPDRAGLTEAEHRARRPRLVSAVDGPLPIGRRIDLAASILRGASLTRGFARLVALLGHGSRTVNNPHAAGLDCGACCGSTGEVNARAAAALLNEPAVRDGLRTRGIDVPPTTWFVGGLHDTTTDDVELFDLDEVPYAHRADVDALADRLRQAGERVRTERAALLGLEGLDAPALRRAVSARAHDWAQVRPEWGLADNAAFVIAPRERTRGADLGGRVFLHEYRWAEDPQFAVLELLLTAPMVVAHWINLQYYASTVEPRKFGSGNKVLHDVVGGGIGVFEGNGGDLRIGLPHQSVHDGQRWVHTPLRLTVVVEAPRQAIDAVLRKHDTVRQLVENRWVHLLQVDGDRVSERTDTGWSAVG